MNRNGAVIWRGPSPIDGTPIVAVVTGLQRASQNRKTGDMAQLWILVDGMLATDAIATDVDRAICGDCLFRGQTGPDGKRVGRACYVNVGQAPRGVSAALLAGSYPERTPESVAFELTGRAVRLGAYGDPALLPIDVVRALIAHASTHTGYTHQWRTVSPAWASLVMASTETLQGSREARALGYRTFRVLPVGESLPAGDVECAATRQRNPLHCADCGMCSGNPRQRGASVAIVAHGSGAKHVA